MCTGFEIAMLVTTILGTGAGIGVSASQAERAEDAANEQARNQRALQEQQGAQALLEQQNYNAKQLELQEKQTIQPTSSATDILTTPGASTADTATAMDYLPGWNTKGSNVTTWA